MLRPGGRRFWRRKGRLSLAALAAEELLLALPIVPLHEAGTRLRGGRRAQLGARAAPAAAEEAGSAARPFADLGRCWSRAAVAKR